MRLSAAFGRSDTASNTGLAVAMGDVEGFFTAAATGDVDGLQMIYAAGFLLLRHTGQINESDLESFVSDRS